MRDEVPRTRIPIGCNGQVLIRFLQTNAYRLLLEFLKFDDGFCHRVIPVFIPGGVMLYIISDKDSGAAASSGFVGIPLPPTQRFSQIVANVSVHTEDKSLQRHTDMDLLLREDGMTSGSTAGG